MTLNFYATSARPNDKCMICFEKLTQDVVIHTGELHPIHKPCILQWFTRCRQNNQNPSCPECRETVNYSSLRQRNISTIMIDAGRSLRNLAIFKEILLKTLYINFPVTLPVFSNLIMQCRFNASTLIICPRSIDSQIIYLYASLFSTFALSAVVNELADGKRAVKVIFRTTTMAVVAFVYFAFIATFPNRQ